MLAKRVSAAVVSDTPQVLFYPRPTIFDGLELSGIEVALPLVGPDERVSPRVEDSPPLELGPPVLASVSNKPVS